MVGEDCYCVKYGWRQYEMKGYKFVHDVGVFKKNFYLCIS